jgi:hypothetical protein
MMIVVQKTFWCCQPHAFNACSANSRTATTMVRVCQLLNRASCSCLTICRNQEHMQSTHVPPSRWGPGAVGPTHAHTCFIHSVAKAMIQPDCHPGWEYHCTAWCQLSINTQPFALTSTPQCGPCRSPCQHRRPTCCSGMSSCPCRCRHALLLRCMHGRTHNTLRHPLHGGHTPIRAGRPRTVHHKEGTEAAQPLARVLAVTAKLL